MKGNLLLVMAFAVLGLTANAQEKKNDNAQMPQRPTKEQMVEMQVNRMANKLMLDEATTSKFTPVYKKYLEEIGALRPGHKAGKEDKKGPQMGMGAPEKKQMTDAEVEEALKARWAMMRKMADIQEKYYGEFKKFLTAKQIQEVMKSGHGGGHHFGMKGGSRMGKAPGRHGRQGRGQRSQVSAPQGKV